MIIVGEKSPTFYLHIIKYNTIMNPNLTQFEIAVAIVAGAFLFVGIVNFITNITLGHYKD